MVGTSGVSGAPGANRPDLGRAMAGLDAIDALGWWLANQDEREKFRQEIKAWMAESERVGVARDLAAARKEAENVRAAAKAELAAAQADADRLRAAADEALAIARREAGEMRAKATNEHSRALQERESATLLMRDTEAAAARAVKANEEAAAGTAKLEADRKAFEAWRASVLSAAQAAPPA